MNRVTIYPIKGFLFNNGTDLFQDSNSKLTILEPQALIENNICPKNLMEVIQNHSAQLFFPPPARAHPNLVHK